MSGENDNDAGDKLHVGSAACQHCWCHWLVHKALQSRKNNEQ